MPRFVSSGADKLPIYLHVSGDTHVGEQVIKKGLDQDLNPYLKIEISNTLEVLKTSRGGALKKLLHFFQTCPGDDIGIHGIKTRIEELEGKDLVSAHIL
jgi:hypothetical protein